VPLDSMVKAASRRSVGPWEDCVAGGNGALHFVDADVVRGQLVRVTCTATAYFWSPKTCTRETPPTMEMRCASMVSRTRSRCRAAASRMSVR